MLLPRIKGIKRGATNIVAPQSLNIGTYDWYKSQRPTEWVSMDDIVTEDDRVAGGKAVMLFLVSKNGCYVHLYIPQNNPNIDWGDGTQTPDCPSNNTHTIDYDALSPSTELPDGFRQAIVTITATSSSKPIKTIVVNPLGESPQEQIAVGSSLTQFTHNSKGVLKLVKILGEHSLSSNVTYFRGLKHIGVQQKSGTNIDSYLYQMPWHYRGEVSMTGITSARYLFKYTDNTNMTITSSPTVSWVGSYMYMYGYNYDCIKPIDYSLCTNFDQFASFAMATYTPLIDMSSASGVNAGRSMFYQARELKQMNIVNCSVEISFAYCTRLPLLEIINFGLTGIVDMTGGGDPTKVRITGSLAKTKLNALGDTGTITHNGTDYTKAEVVALFEDKNWELVL